MLTLVHDSKPEQWSKIVVAKLLQKTLQLVRLDGKVNPIHALVEQIKQKSERCYVQPEKECGDYHEDDWWLDQDKQLVGGVWRLWKLIGVEKSQQKVDVWQFQ